MRWKNIYIFEMKKMPQLMNKEKERNMNGKELLIINTNYVIDMNDDDQQRWMKKSRNRMKILLDYQNDWKGLNLMVCKIVTTKKKNIFIIII